MSHRGSACLAWASACHSVFRVVLFLLSEYPAHHWVSGCCFYFLFLGSNLRLLKRDNSVSCYKLALFHGLIT